MRRPDTLPDFSKPPLAEVVLGIQFSPVPAYSSVDARQVWELFKEAFPVVEERPLLAPQFETFGGANRPSSLGFHVGPPPVGSRLWFLSQDANHLIQFQSDRFLTNWRNGPNLQPYPRFEVIADSFERNLQILADHFMAALKVFSPSSEPNGGMSVDIERLMLADGVDPREYVTTPVFTGSVAFSAGAARALGLIVGYDPIPTNPYRGEVWSADRPNRFSRQQRGIGGCPPVVRRAR